ncbi:hypothetical protein [Roseateles sp. YR242]|uniref:hypothetical protein n=1 Tax=Roseateles sp. YR242 TaxID=1855305 RepID=UPI0015A6D461|nr:hypothetical protein [Roseateles sp. YR242]
MFFGPPWPAWVRPGPQASLCRSPERAIGPAIGRAISTTISMRTRHIGDGAPSHVLG